MLTWELWNFWGFACCGGVFGNDSPAALFPCGSCGRGRRRTPCTPVLVPLETTHTHIKLAFMYSHLYYSYRYAGYSSILYWIMPWNKHCLNILTATNICLQAHRSFNKANSFLEVFRYLLTLTAIGDGYCTIFFSKHVYNVSAATAQPGHRPDIETRIWKMHGQTATSKATCWGRF